MKAPSYDSWTVGAHGGSLARLLRGDAVTIYIRLRDKCKAERSQIAKIVERRINEFIDQQEQTK